jgi:predicted nucleic acid-binding protein
MIAGIALALGLTVVTDNNRKFDRVHGLVIENWRHSGNLMLQSQ